MTKYHGPVLGYRLWVWDPWFRRSYWYFMCQNQGLKWFDSSGVHDLLTLQFSRIFQIWWKAIRIYSDWSFFWSIIVAPNFFYLFMQTFLCCSVVIALRVSPHFFWMEICGNLIFVLLHIWGAQQQSGGSCAGLKCWYRFMHNVWQHALYMTA